MNAKCGFRNKSSTGLKLYLKEKSVTEIYIAGLAANYCVKCSILDVCLLGFNTFVICDAIRGVDLMPKDNERAFGEKENAGAKIIACSVTVRN